MINKESLRRKIEGSQKESRRQKRKETEREERESRGYSKKDRGERQKIEDKKSRTWEKRLKRIGSERTRIKKYMFHLQNRQQQRKEGRK